MRQIDSISTKGATLKMDDAFPSPDLLAFQQFWGFSVIETQSGCCTLIVPQTVVRSWHKIFSVVWSSSAALLASKGGNANLISV